MCAVTLRFGVAYGLREGGGAVLANSETLTSSLIILIEFFYVFFQILQANTELLA